VNADGTQQNASSVIPLYGPPDVQYTATGATPGSTDFTFDYSFSDPSDEPKYFLLQFIGLYKCQTIGCTDTMARVFKYTTDLQETYRSQFSRSAFH
jgi:hypothetical protein